MVGVKLGTVALLPVNEKQDHGDEAECGDENLTVHAINIKEILKNSCASPCKSRTSIGKVEIIAEAGLQIGKVGDQFPEYGFLDGTELMQINQVTEVPSIFS